MSSKVLVNQVKLDDYPAVCDVCGLSYWASTMKFRWDKVFVDDKCWEPYPDGYKTKVIVDKQTVPVARPRTTKMDANAPAASPAVTSAYTSSDFLNSSGAL
jgi:hypothetical protein